MKIYTKTGDKGKTSLVGGARVDKNHVRLEAYGTVDELIAFTGLLRDQDMQNTFKEQLISIQDKLMILSSHLATNDESIASQLPELYNDDIKALETYIDEMDNQLPPLTSFVLPGGHPTVSYCHVCRTVCRRAERIVVSMDESIQINPVLLKYLNRLSDYFFILSRQLSRDLNAVETVWKT